MGHHPEDLPDERNYVSLDPELKDSDGLPAPKLHYRTSENTRLKLDWNLARSLEAHRRPAQQGVDLGRDLRGHNLGTASMGDDPATSVIDRYGRSHDVPNLYMIDGSVFVTASAANPTSTICALAKRTATYISTHARLQEVAA